MVLRVQRLREGEGSKYLWPRVRLIDTIKNQPGFHFPPELEIAHLSSKKGLPAEECTVYLVRYNDTDPHLWKLLDGDGERGVSNVGSPAD